MVMGIWEDISSAVSINYSFISGLNQDESFSSEAGYLG